jgi:hypothetical protein
MKSRLAFGQWVDKVFWAMTIAIASYMAGQVNNLTQGVNELNAKMAAIVERSSNQEKRMDGFDARLRDLERLPISGRSSMRSH